MRQNLTKTKRRDRLQIKFVDSIIQTQNLCYKEILKNISVDIKRGEYVAIIGPNGGGKSTFVKLLLGLLKSSSGVIKLFGKEQSGFLDKQKIGYVPQGVSRIDENFPISVEETVRLGISGNDGFFGLFSAKKRDDYEFANETMKKMGVFDLKDRRVYELSGGQRQRVMIARALASKPQILILDEPNTGVDSGSQRGFYELLDGLNKKDGITILFVTHDLGVIADSVGKVLCINKNLLACHNPHEIMSCSSMSKLYGIDAHVVCHHH